MSKKIKSTYSELRKGTIMGLTSDMSQKATKQGKVNSIADDYISELILMLHRHSMTRVRIMQSEVTLYGVQNAEKRLKLK